MDVAFEVDRLGAAEVLVPVDTEVVTFNDELVRTEGAVIPILTIDVSDIVMLSELEDFAIDVMGSFHPGGEGAELNTAWDQLPICALLVLAEDDITVLIDVHAGHGGAGVGGDGESESDESHD